MPIDFTDFTKIPIREKEIGNIFSDILQGFKMQREPAKMNAEQKKIDLENLLSGVKVKFAEPEAQESLKGKRLSNQILGTEAKYADQKALADIDGKNLSNQHAKILIDQLKLTNPILSQQLEEDLKLKQAKVLQENLVKDLLSNAFGTQSGNQEANLTGENQNSNPMNLGSGNEQPKTAGNPNNGLNYQSAAFLMHKLGMGKPEIKADKNGKYMAMTPFGNFETGVSPITKGQETLGKADAEKIAALEDSVLGNAGKLETYDQLNGILNSPAFEDIRKRGYAGKYELGYYSKFGTQKQKELIGKFDALAGNIIKESARDFAGQFRTGEQALLTSMKPNESDTLPVMKGKLDALNYMTTSLSKRAEIEADLMRNQGMSPLQAKREADKIIKPSEIRKVMMDRINTSKGISSGKVTMMRDGKSYQIDPDHVEDAIKDGFTKVK